MNIIKKIWRNYIHKLDKAILGPAITSVASKHPEYELYENYAWAMHKLIDPNYDENDLTIEEIKALVTVTEINKDKLENTNEN